MSKIGDKAYILLRSVDANENPLYNTADKKNNAIYLHFNGTDYDLTLNSKEQHNLDLKIVSETAELSCTNINNKPIICLLYTSPSPRDA